MKKPPDKADPLHFSIELCLTYSKLCHGLHGGNFTPAPPGNGRVKAGIFLWRPRYLRCCLAKAMPLRWRWRMYSRLSWSTTVNAVSMNLPADAVVPTEIYIKQRFLVSGRARPYLTHREDTGCFRVKPCFYPRVSAPMYGRYGREVAYQSPAH